MLLAACGPSRSVTTYVAPLPVSRIDSILTASAAQYRLLARELPAGRFPRNWDPAAGKLNTSGSDWWCSGYYPGTLLYLYERTKDTALYREALRMLPLLEKEQHNTGTHDLGFMMFCSFGNALRIAPKPGYEDILVQSARSLATRYSPVTRSIRSWDSNKDEFLVIIDNMMNLELLFWASKHTGDSTFRNIALTHANTTIANHFRPDGSSYHVLNYDDKTGAVKQKRTAQGYSDASAWARGQAWGLYGFTVLYRETKGQRYLDQAVRIADFLLGHPRMPADGIPYWDFDAPAIPDAPRDASAAAIMASALLELRFYADGSFNASRYVQAAEKILVTLSSDAYRAAAGTNGGFLLRHSVGHLPAKSEVDVAITYADYYYVEALLRYRDALTYHPRKK
ncbi:glycoside hydrolase family 88 protein [Flaviaesturariibacter amylovorans]|uniref:Glycoside hydrolase family 88 protein n=1 Tax=Flaviaesturariibacter amylovorans TaxID=1084520 RepID=A0ABP8HNE4_9BACT